MCVSAVKMPSKISYCRNRVNKYVTQIKILNSLVPYSVTITDHFSIPIFYQFFIKC